MTEQNTFKQNTLLISVIIPTCHRNDLLAKCLGCLAPGIQALPPEQYEVIVTDDGSRSTAKQMVRDSYPWVRWVEGPRLGPAANRNHGAKAATGEFLAFTDDDCLPKPGWLGAFASALIPAVQVYEGKTTCEAGIHSPLEESPINLTGGCLWSCNFMVRRSVFGEINGFDTAFPVPGGEDIDLRERLEKNGFGFPFVEAAVVDHPPRRTRWGVKSAILWESQVLLWHKAGKTKLLPARLLVLVAKVRLKNLTRHSLRWHSLSAFASLVIELSYVAGKVLLWQNKHALDKG